jgi:hypothetical protein
MEGEDNLWKLTGHFEFKGTLNGPNSLKGSREGMLKLELQDGTIYRFEDPTMIVNHLVTGQKNHMFIEKGYIRDEKNGVVAELIFNPWSDNTYGGMIKRGWGGLAKKVWGKKKKEEDKQIKRSDDVHLTIYHNEQQVSCGEGSWLSHLVIDDEVVWTIDSDVP